MSDATKLKLLLNHMEWDDVIPILTTALADEVVAAARDYDVERAGMYALVHAPA